MTKRSEPDTSFPFNGLSIHSMTLNQAGDLEVEFDLPSEQKTTQWQVYTRGTRTFDVYQDEELQEACRQLFDIVRERMRAPDPEREAVHCDSCRSSSCCRKYNVLVTESDVERLIAGLGLSRRQLRERYLSDAVDWCADYRWQLACDEDEEGEEKCVFLLPDDEGRMRCSIYEHRPEICRAFDMRTCDDFIPLEQVRVLSD